MIRAIAKFQTKMFMLRNDEKGATAVEYGLMVALIAVVIIIAVGALGGRLGELFDEITTAL